MARSFSQGCGVFGCTLCTAQGGMIPPDMVYVPSPNRGMGGFDGRGQEDFEPAAGVVTGIRWWVLPVPDLSRDPMTAEEHWPRRLLHGMQAEWQPGLNEAVCLQQFIHPVPELSCGCGMWSFWREQPYPLGTGIPVLGVIEGSGRTLIGEAGSRCQRARIVALHVPPAGVLSAWCEYESTVTYAWYDASGILTRTVPELPSQDAWLAVISDRLRQLYPDAKVYESRDALLRLHPPDDPPPAPELPRAQCPFCTARMTAAELAAHAPCCPLRLP